MSKYKRTARGNHHDDAERGIWAHCKSTPAGRPPEFRRWLSVTLVMYCLQQFSNHIDKKKHCREESVSLKIMCEIKFTSIYTIVQGVAALAALWARER